MPRPRKPHDIVALQLRLPVAMRDQIAAEAERNKRSLNSEILFRLSETMDNRWTDYVAALERQAQSDAEFIERMRANPESRALLEHLITKIVPKKKD
jgi:hypothetical protein